MNLFKTRRRNFLGGVVSPPAPVEEDVSVSFTIDSTRLVATTGNTSSASGQRCTDFIEIPSGYAKLKYTTGSSAFRFRGCWYKSNKSFDSVLANDITVAKNTTFEADIPSDAKYFRMSSQSVQLNSTITVTLIA